MVRQILVRKYEKKIFILKHVYMSRTDLLKEEWLLLVWIKVYGVYTEHPEHFGAHVWRHAQLRQRHNGEQFKIPFWARAFYI